MGKRVFLGVAIVGLCLSVPSGSPPAQAEDARAHRIAPIHYVSEDVEILYGDPEKPREPF